MERPNTVAGLIDKRRELLRLVDEAQEVLQGHLASLDHLTATILLFDPKADVTGMTPQRAPSPHRAFKGDMKRHVLQSLRLAKAPITSMDMTRTFVDGRGMDREDAITVRKRVGACLWKLERDGLAVSVPQDGEYKGWRLANKNQLFIRRGIKRSPLGSSKLIRVNHDPPRPPNHRRNRKSAVRRCRRDLSNATKALT